jgi:NAD dependent epimerase/dehydratase family
MLSNSALIGFSGFVGSNISSQSKFDFYFNSKNLDLLLDHDYDLVICAGVPAVKWWANQNAFEDFSIINNLIKIYGSISCKRFVLISTVDVYPEPFDVNEFSEIDSDLLHAYGRNRLMLERELEKRFESFHIIRLPALFGPGLKKNILFDLINNHQLCNINTESTFQWYPLRRICSDIRVVLDYDIKLINITSQPILTSEIVGKFFASLSCGPASSIPVHYNVKTIHGNLFHNNNSHYLLDKPSVIQEISSWLSDLNFNYA